MNNIKLHLSRLADFAGRENREPFWWWVLTIYIGQMALGMVVAIPLQLKLMNAMQPMQDDPTYLDRHPEYAVQMMNDALVPFVRYMIFFGLIVGVIHMALLAAAVTRRLHDRDRSGWWAAPVPVIQIATTLGYLSILSNFMHVVTSIGPDGPTPEAMAALQSLLPVFALFALLGLVGLVVMIVLIVQLVQRGTVGPNRYGADLLPPPELAYPPPPAWQPPPAPPAPARIARGDWSDQPPN